MSKNDKKYISQSFLFNLTGRFSLFLMLFMNVLLIFYISGNFQNFLDSTQRFIMLLCSITCILLFLFLAAGFIESIILSIIRRLKKYIIFMIVYFAGIIYVAAVYAFLRIVLYLSNGIF